MIKIIALQRDDPSANFAEAISQLGMQTFRETFGSLFEERGLKTYLERTFAPAKIATSLQKENNSYLLAYEDTLPVGYLKMKIHSPENHIESRNPSQLQKIYVLSEHHSKGIGQQLLDLCITQARALKKDCLWLDVLSTNAKAIRFYEKNGFKKIGTASFTIGNRDFLYDVMNLELT